MAGAEADRRPEPRVRGDAGAGATRGADGPQLAETDRERAQGGHRNGAAGGRRGPLSDAGEDWEVGGGGGARRLRLLGLMMAANRGGDMKELPTLFLKASRVISHGRRTSDI